MKTLMFVMALVVPITVFAFDVFDIGMTQQEATSRAMKRCIDNSQHPERCHVIQANQGDYGPYAKWSVQVADWTR